MKKVNLGYEVDFLNKKIILRKSFHKEASVLDSEAYKTMMKLREDNPGFALELKDFRKKEGKKSYRNLTYANMEQFIIAHEGEGTPAAKAALSELEKVKQLSKVQKGPYAFVKEWFLKKYKDAIENTEEEAATPKLTLVTNS